MTLVLLPRPHGAPWLVYAGATLPDVDLDVLAAAVAEGSREAQPDDPPGLSILPESGFGFLGAPGIIVEHGDRRSETRFETAALTATPGAMHLRMVDAVAALAVDLDWSLDAATGVLASHATVRNTGDRPARLHWLAAVALPLPGWARHAVRAHGRWGHEWQLSTLPLVAGRLVTEAMGGRPGFDGPGHAMLHDDGAREGAGRVVVATLAWSGAPRTTIETLPSGARQLQQGAVLGPGEIVLSPGETHTTPTALVAIADGGWNAASAMLHRHLRAARAAAGVGQGPRKVHFNSWEAVYFDFDLPRLQALASAAAALGVERFVLDDGWFAGRRDDTSALGDWTPDPVRFPDGLAPLIAHVHAAGMDFGLWVEPEMVSPDSELARTHPDWCLDAPGRDRPTARHQLVLDLTHPAVAARLFATLDALLTGDAIAYLKWDHNRDLFPNPTGYAQTCALYALLDRLRAAHPKVEIETCASGGGRVDHAMLTRAARGWASDNTDAVARLPLQAAMTRLFPLETIGAHVGPARNPTTGRRFDMAYRARIAIFGHMGVEADPRTLDDRDRDTLARHIALYKTHRMLLHTGVLHRLDTDDATALLVVAEDGSEALLLAATTGQAGPGASPPLCLTGLDPARRYRVDLLDPWPRLAARQLGAADWWRTRPVIDGATLCQSGLRLPLVHPETAWLAYLSAEAISDVTSAGR